MIASAIMIICISCRCFWRRRKVKLANRVQYIYARKALCSHLLLKGEQLPVDSAKAQKKKKKKPLPQDEERNTETLTY
jgi:hypothetical protein